MGLALELARKGGFAGKRGRHGVSCELCGGTLYDGECQACGWINVGDEWEIEDAEDAEDAEGEGGAGTRGGWAAT